MLEPLCMLLRWGCRKMRQLPQRVAHTSTMAIQQEGPHILAVRAALGHSGGAEKTHDQEQVALTVERSLTKML